MNGDVIESGKDVGLNADALLDFHFEDAVRHHAVHSPDLSAITFADQSFSYRDFDRITNQLSNGFAQLGCKHGDRIAVVLRNCPESYMSLVAARKLGAVQVAINSRYRPGEIAWIVNDCGAEIVVIDSDLLPEAQQIASAIGRPVTLFAAGQGNDIVPGLLDWAAEFSDEDLGITSARDDVAIQLYTSGTTGNPKGAMITNANLRSFLLNAAEALPMRQHGSHLVMLPLFHVAALIWSVRAFIHGGHCVGLNDFDPKAILALIPQYGINDFATVNTVLTMVMQQADAETDLSSLDAIIFGGGALGEKNAKEALKIFGCPLYSMYGSTELTYGVTVLKIDEDLLDTPQLLQSCGKPMLDIEVGIFDTESQEPLADGISGELWVRGGQKSLGYWNNPDATRAAFREDGWFRTGDIGYVRDGNLFINDRLKDMIKSGGENVYPAEVERRLSNHPAVAEAIVIGIPDDKWGEAVHAHIIKRAGSDVSEAEVIAFAKETMAPFKCPRSIKFVDDVPRTPSGKPKKNIIRESYWADRERKIS